MLYKSPRWSISVYHLLHAEARAWAVPNRFHKHNFMKKSGLNWHILSILLLLLEQNKCKISITQKLLSQLIQFRNIWISNKLSVIYWGLKRLWNNHYDDFQNVFIIWAIFHIYVNDRKSEFQYGIWISIY